VPSTKKAFQWNAFLVENHSVNYFLLTNHCHQLLGPTAVGAGDELYMTGK
jgi:hypothetical protein